MSGEKFDIVSCPGCGLMFTNPIPVPAALGEYYKSESYISHSDTRKGIISQAYHLVRLISLRQKQKLVERYVSRGTVLDYGCGTGSFLKHLAANGWRTVGIEPDTGARALAGNDVFADLIEYKKRHQAGHFDLITLWHVLEHVFDLSKLLLELRDLLAPDGALIVAVPNLTSFDASHYGEHWAAYDVPRHLYHFSPECLTALLVRHGFSLAATHPMKFDSYYVSLLSEKYRHNRTRFLPAIFTGIRSNASARKPTDYSSVIYVFRKQVETV